MAIFDVLMGSAATIVGLGCTAGFTVVIAALTKGVWDKSFGKDKVDVYRVLANEIENLQVRLLQKEFKNATKPSYIVEFFQNDNTIYVAKIALVGVIGYGVWKWMVIEVRQKISHSGNDLDLHKKLYGLIPLDGSSCKLYRMDEQDIVAEAIWVTDDPAAQVHGCVLGRNASKVWVTNVVEPNAKVWRPTFGIQIMEEATKSFIAWPSDRIIYI